MKIINDILDYSKIEAGKLEMDMVECSVSEILVDIDHMLRPTIQDKSLEFKILQADGLPAKICTDPERLGKLAEAVNAGDAKQIKLYAHAVKGASRNIGAQRLSELAHCLEYAGQEQDIESAKQLFEEVRAELEKVISFLSRSDWIEIAKKEKIVTDEKINAKIT